MNLANQICELENWDEFNLLWINFVMQYFFSLRNEAFAFLKVLDWKIFIVSVTSVYNCFQIHMSCSIYFIISLWPWFVAKLIMTLVFGNSLNSIICLFFRIWRSERNVSDVLLSQSTDCWFCLHQCGTLDECLCRILYWVHCAVNLHNALPEIHIRIGSEPV